MSHAKGRNVEIVHAIAMPMTLSLHIIHASYRREASGRLGVQIKSYNILNLSKNAILYFNIIL